MSYFLIYLIMILDNIVEVVRLTTITTGFGLIVMLVVLIACYVENWDNDTIHTTKVLFYVARLTKFVLISFIFSLMITMFLPTTKQAAVIYVLPKLMKTTIESKGLKTLPAKLVKLANLYVDKLSKDSKE